MRKLKVNLLLVLFLKIGKTKFGVLNRTVIDLCVLCRQAIGEYIIKPASGLATSLLVPLAFGEIIAIFLFLLLIFSLWIAKKYQNYLARIIGVLAVYSQDTKLSAAQR